MYITPFSTAQQHHGPSRHLGIGTSTRRGHRRGAPFAGHLRGNRPPPRRRGASTMTATPATDVGSRGSIKRLLRPRAYTVWEARAESLSFRSGGRDERRSSSPPPAPSPRGVPNPGRRPGATTKPHCRGVRPGRRGCASSRNATGGRGSRSHRSVFEIRAHRIEVSAATRPVFRRGGWMWGVSVEQGRRSDELPGA
jgi:hypothetical protein